MKLKTIAKCAALGLALSVMPLQAQNKINDSTKFFSLSRLTVGGYGEAVYTRNFYSDNMFRYSHAERYNGRLATMTSSTRRASSHTATRVCRAQTVIEAIMWHGNAQSDARRTVEKFRELSKEDRDAVVKFIDAI